MNTAPTGSGFGSATLDGNLLWKTVYRGERIRSDMKLFVLKPKLTMKGISKDFDRGRM